MMEDFIRKNIDEETADFYKNSSKKVKTQMDIGIISILAFSENEQPVSIKKETVIDEHGKVKARYTLEVDLVQKKR
ncbi:hypothetical protein [Enterococcus faecalis]|uniref:hypothetical protein n=1 Tax=Enterococcus TaxID=1350 RepID=UPI000F8033E7|nr:hypothetical protein [Enterococcus faecalis]EGO6570126.1 hypothetical protein [Enterococcus faecalis]EGO6690052.1 hypothetical protein [Enterococcus faecalis]EGO7756702.1 hypothetical protein [Enterococcus faecalis]EGO8279973.1 hypothetical protein [Enterococcus faecalis]EGO8520006.1 hypothetical protein [Enterococcus faecalis]